MHRPIADFAAAYLKTALGRIAAFTAAAGLIGTVLTFLDPALSSYTGLTMFAAAVGLVVTPYSVYYEVWQDRNKAHEERSRADADLAAIRNAAPRVVFDQIPPLVEMFDQILKEEDPSVHAHTHVPTWQVVRSYMLRSVWFKNMPTVHKAESVARAVRARIRIVDQAGNTVFDKTGRWANPDPTIKAHESDHGRLDNALPTIDIDPGHQIAQLPVLMKMTSNTDPGWYVFISSEYRDHPNHRINPGTYALTVSLTGQNVQETPFLFQLTDQDGLPCLEPFVSWTRRADL